MTPGQSLHRPISIAVVTLALFITPCFTQEEEQNLTPEKWLEQFDANKDGKLEKTETSGLMERFFDRNDINKDTFLDGQELQELAGVSRDGRHHALRVTNETRPAQNNFSPELQTA